MLSRYCKANINAVHAAVMMPLGLFAYCIHETKCDNYWNFVFHFSAEVYVNIVVTVLTVVMTAITRFAPQKSGKCLLMYSPV